MNYLVTYKHEQFKRGSRLEQVQHVPDLYFLVGTGLTFSPYSDDFDFWCENEWITEEDTYPLISDEEYQQLSKKPVEYPLLNSLFYKIVYVVTGLNLIIAMANYDLYTILGWFTAFCFVVNKAFDFKF